MSLNIVVTITWTYHKLDWLLSPKRLRNCFTCAREASSTQYSRMQYLWQVSCMHTESAARSSARAADDTLPPQRELTHHHTLTTPYLCYTTLHRLWQSAVVLLIMMCNIIFVIRIYTKNLKSFISGKIIYNI